MSLKNRSYEKELLDGDNIPFRDILVNMQELNKVNTYLGGHRITLKGITHFLGKVRRKTPLTIAEIGCGGGDNLTVVHKHLEKRKQSHSLIGVDIKPECVQYAKQCAKEDINWICSDYRTVTWPGQEGGDSAKPDIIFSSLFCHHFTNEELVEQLRWLKENSRIGFFINDLHRHPLAYYSIRLLTMLFSKSYLVKNDGPLSVKRGFRKNEWIKLLNVAGITRYTVEWQWAFRYLICVDNE